MSKFDDLIKIIESGVSEEKCVAQIRAILKKSPELVNQTNYVPETITLYERINYYSTEEIRRNLTREEIQRSHSYGFTLLHFAATFGKADIIEELIAQGANIEAKNYHGSTALHMAALNGQVSAIRKLLKLGANIEATNGAAYTPLHLATDGLFGHMNALTELIANGAYVLAKNNSGRTPHQLIIDNLKINFSHYPRLSAFFTVLIESSVAYLSIDPMRIYNLLPPVVQTYLAAKPVKTEVIEEPVKELPFIKLCVDNFDLLLPKLPTYIEKRLFETNDVINPMLPKLALQEIKIGTPDSTWQIPTSYQNRRTTTKNQNRCSTLH